MRPRYHAAVLAAALAAILSPTQPSAQGGAPAFTADEITEILKPAVKEPPLRTRGLQAGGGAEGPAPAPAPPPGESGSGVLPDLRILFGYDSDALSPEARAQLDALAEALRGEELRDYRFVVGGHTDVAGAEGYNEDLSRRRAAAVVSYLAGEKGVPADRLTAEGHGERQLADPADPTSGRNRRVEVRTEE